MKNRDCLAEIIVIAFLAVVIFQSPLTTDYSEYSVLHNKAYSKTLRFQNQVCGDCFRSKIIRAWISV